MTEEEVGMFNMKLLLINLLVLCCSFQVTTAIAQTNPEDLKASVHTIVNREGYRSYQDTATLNAVGAWIFDQFSQYSSDVFYQGYHVNDVVYNNVVARIGDTTLPTIVIGAHYDSYSDLPGADDNASGVAGMIETMRQLQNYTGNFCLEFVAFTLEEPPFFSTIGMGSYQHAKRLHASKRNVYGMISIEMIGYFSDVEGSQEYPIGMMKWFYGKKADFILCTKKMVSGQFSRRITKNMLKNKHLKTNKINAPKFIRGIDFSDHRNYWAFGYDAFMLTDTSFYRNANYHHATDTPETLDYVRMAKVVDELVAAINAL